MRRIHQGLFILVLLVLALAIFFTARGRKGIIVTSPVPVQPAVSVQPAVAHTKRGQPVKTVKAARTAEKEITPVQTTEKETATIPAADALNEFALPQALKTELQQAADSGEVIVEWGHGRISNDELQAAGVTIAQLSERVPAAQSENISAGYSIPDELFAQELSNCLPEQAAVEAAEQAPEDPGVRILNSEALSSMAFSALMEHNPAQAEQAFTALIHNYADTEAAPMAHLELARLFFEEGRSPEAQQLVDKAASLYSNDKEYLLLAQGLKEAIEADE